jgi:hypothetical protein
MTARLVCGWGHNDMVGVPGWRTKDCPFYQKWTNMLERCYDKNYLNDNPTYRDVTVCEEWKFFSAFKEWAETKDWEERKQLDKDILIPGNKKYRPDACLVVTNHINNLKLRTDPEKPKSGKKYPQGVFLSERLKGPDKYVSVIVTDGKRIRLGTFPTVEAASSAYCKKKAEYLRELAEKQKPKETILKEALLRWADIYELEIVYLRDNKR